MTAKKKKWTPPDWIKPYLPLITNTGGNDPVELYNGNADPLVNLPLSTIQAMTKAQISLLEQLRDRGHLDPSAKDIERLCGYVEDGSHSTVKIFQDDATRSWCVQVERASYYGNTMREALKAAGEIK